MRLIDADKVMEEINQIGGHGLSGWSTIGVKDLIDRQPTVDIKSEVAKIFAEIEKTMASEYNEFMFNTEGVGMNALNVVVFSDRLDDAIAELKNKYIGGVGE